MTLGSFNIFTPILKYSISRSQISTKVLKILKKVSSSVARRCPPLEECQIVCLLLVARFEGCCPPLEQLWGMVDAATRRSLPQKNRLLANSPLIIIIIGGRARWGFFNFKFFYILSGRWKASWGKPSRLWQNVKICCCPIFDGATSKSWLTLVPQKRLKV